MTRQALDKSAAEHDAGHDTVHHGSADAHPSAPPAPQISKAKVCCICGENVAGQRRYKDGAGRYYCELCFTEQTQDSGDAGSDPTVTQPASSRSASAPARKKQRLIHCPDCKGEFSPEALVDFGGTKLCEKCLHQRELSAKREAARIAAAEEEARQQEHRKRMWTLVGVSVAAVVVIYLVLRFALG